jgi:hypothetical protein
VQNIAKNEQGKPTVDPSGLFMEDTTPTPLEELLRKTTPRHKPSPGGTKRKLDEGDNAQDDPISHVHRPKTKKTRVSSNSQKDVPSSTNGATGDPEQAAGAPDPDDDSFLKEVREKLTAKEKKKREKSNKKRKRESAGSEGAAPLPAPVNRETPTTQPQKKKRKTEAPGPPQKGEHSPKAKAGRTKGKQAKHRGGGRAKKKK